MSNAIYTAVAERLSQVDGRIVVCVVQAGCVSRVYGPADLSKIKAEGGGLRIGKLFVFAQQIKFARVAKA